MDFVHVLESMPTFENRHWFAFHDTWWGRDCFSNIKLSSITSRSLDDAISNVCCAIEERKRDGLADIHIHADGSTLAVKAVRKSVVEEATLRKCPKCGGYVYGDARNGPLHPLNECEDVMIEKIMHS